MYEGKDYDIIKTIFEHLNADLNVIDIDDTIPDPTENPWFSSLDMENKSEVQRGILKTWNITMLTKSQRVLENDGVVEVTYPHTDNAVTLLLPKRRQITKPEEVYEYVTQPIWYLHFTMLAVSSVLAIVLRKYFGMNNIFGTARHLFRIMYTCSTSGFIGNNLEEILLFAWLIWCFLISIMAQAKITSMLSTDLYESELDSIDDVYRRGKLDFIIFGLNSYVEEIAEKYEGSKYMGIIQDMVKVPMDENLGEIMLLEMPKPTTFKMAIILEHDIAKFYSRHMKNRQDGGWGKTIFAYDETQPHALLSSFSCDCRISTTSYYK
ncbi:uncharacterized protein LOC123680465 [Harmonia axyridis]|uniref:uncharacterized protein LOC123680465 n=1 Tax=Harmonia axyridis TaxID=115357 RepID=UPI001E276775|nr:uncharacterized protein LOC123680465 [Harmonia axyridis]